MMIKECNTDELEIMMLEHKEAIFHRVSRSPIFVKDVRNGFVLAPDKPLHQDYQNGRITWDEYVPRYTKQIEESPKAQEYLEKIREQVKEKDVYLVCFCGRDVGDHCHRFLLMDAVG
jgi:hypothetical protein